MRRSSTLLAIAAMTMLASSPALAQAVPPAVSPAPPPRRRAVPTQPESARDALRREIAEHNVSVAARRAEKLARRGTNRKG